LDPQPAAAEAAVGMAAASVIAGKAMLCLRGVHKTYTLGNQEVRALDGVDLDVVPGEFTAITGPSGSGKSTLMHIVGCLDVPTSGSYKFDGIEVADMDEYELAHIRNQKIGFVFQGFNLLSRTSALENVKLPMIYGMQKNPDERAISALKRVGLGDRLDHSPNELSGGQQQRVAIARAIATAPRLLLADEPTGNLASLQSEEVMEVFQSLNDEGSTIVMVTHEPDIAKHCKRIVSVRDGHIIDDEMVENRLDAKQEVAKLILERSEDDRKRAEHAAAKAEATSP
jgi:putative ABC transport system ATP-binding protein